MMASTRLPAAGVAVIMLVSSAQPAAAQTHSRVKKPAVPGEQAPPADPGQNNFGAPITRPGLPGQRPPAPPRRPGPKFLLILHHAEARGPRKPQIWDVDDSGDELVLKERYGD